MKKKCFNSKGFTLVELVVVIAIIGILASILVPSMMGYVKKARLKTANSNAKVAYNAAIEYARTKEVEGIDPRYLFADGDFDTNYVDVTSAVQDGDKIVADILSDNGGDAGGFCIIYTTLSNGKEAIVAQWAKTSSDDVIGQYPDPVQWDNWESNHSGWSIGTYMSPT